MPVHKHALWRIGCGLVFCMPVLSVFAESESLPAGQVMESVACSADATQSYALYLPVGYTPDRQWPVLYCLDPGGRGRQPVERFRAAADKFGYILAGSNNSRNGPWADNARGLEAMMKDTAARLSLDRRRVYLCGFSGGARVASQLAAVGLARGVIACGGTFPTSEAPEKVQCLYYGVAGTDDFNYPEHRQIDDALEKRGAIHRLAVYAGGHEWLPEQAAIDAIEWLEVQSMRIGLREPDARVIAESVRRRKAALGGLTVPERWLETRSLVADFTGIVKTDALQKSLDELAKSPEIAVWRKEERAMERRQKAMIDQLLGGTGGELIPRLRKQGDAPADSSERRVARRVLQGAFIGSIEAARGLIAEGEYAAAVAQLETAVMVQPEKPSTHVELARARALEGNRKGALSALKEAASRGYRDGARLDREQAFSSLKTSEEFTAVRKQVEANAAGQESDHKK